MYIGQEICWLRRRRINKHCRLNVVMDSCYVSRCWLHLLHFHMGLLTATHELWAYEIKHGAIFPRCSSMKFSLRSLRCTLMNLFFGLWMRMKMSGGPNFLHQSFFAKKEKISLMEHKKLIRNQMLLVPWCTGWELPWSFHSKSVFPGMELQCLGL